MAGMSTYLANAIINATMRNVQYTSPATVYLALCTADPDTTPGSEISAPSYTREPIVLGAPSNGVATNASATTFEVATTAWGTISWIAVYDSATNGNLLYSAQLTSPQTITLNRIFSIPAGQLSITLS